MATISHVRTTNAVSAGVGDIPAVDLPQEYRELRRWEAEACESVDPNERLPLWVSAVLLVGYCGVFWVGAITIGNWFWNAMSALIS